MSENKTCTIRLSQKDIETLDRMRRAVKTTKSGFISFLINQAAGNYSNEKGGASCSERQ